MKKCCLVFVVAFVIAAPVETRSEKWCRSAGFESQENADPFLSPIIRENLYPYDRHCVCRGNQLRMTCRERPEGTVCGCIHSGVGAWHKVFLEAVPDDLRDSVRRLGRRALTPNMEDRMDEIFAHSVGAGVIEFGERFRVWGTKGMVKLLADLIVSKRVDSALIHDRFRCYAAPHHVADIKGPKRKTRTHIYLDFLSPQDLSCQRETAEYPGYSRVGEGSLYVLANGASEVGLADSSGVGRLFAPVLVRHGKKLEAICKTLDLSPIPPRTYDRACVLGVTMNQNEIWVFNGVQRSTQVLAKLPLTE